MNSNTSYLSKISLRCWDVINNQMVDGIDFVIFSKDLKKKAVITVMLDGKKITGMNFSYDATILEMLKEQPKEKFIYLCGAGRAQLLGSNNMLYKDDGKVRGKGDYYHALDYKQIGLFYNMITNKKNLAWVQAKD